MNEYSFRTDPRLSVGDRAELEIYYRGGYPEAARQVDLCIRHGDKPCIGEDCDDLHTCKRHDRTLQVVRRLVRMRNRNDMSI